MKVWKAAGAAAAVLSLAVLALAWAPAVSGQQVFAVKKADGQDGRVVIRERGPMTQSFSMLSGGPRLGVTIRDVASEDVTKLKLPGQAGVVIDEVEKDSAAAKAGVLKGDVAVSFDGETLRSAAHLTRLVRETAPGRTVKMTVVRDGKRVDLSVAPSESRGAAFRHEGQDLDIVIEKELQEKLGALKGKEKDFALQWEAMPRGHAEAMPHFFYRSPGGPMMFRGPGGDPDVFAFSMGRGRLGVTVQDLTPELAEFFGTKDGVLVSAVSKDTPAAKAGLKAGDVITAIDGTSVESSSELVDQLREKSGEITVSVMRDKKALSLKATLEKPEDLKPKTIRRGVGA